LYFLDTPHFEQLIYNLANRQIQFILLINLIFTFHHSDLDGKAGNPDVTNWLTAFSAGRRMVLENLQGSLYNIEIHRFGSGHD
jgi:hypothetical protein